MNIQLSKRIPCLSFGFAFGVLLAGCGGALPSGTNAGPKISASPSVPAPATSTVASTPAPAPAPAPAPTTTASAVFAGGCFWCMEKPFDQMPGVISTTSGYTGGRLLNPTYQQVGSGGTGHIEAVKIVYDPARVTYAQLLDTYWKQVDPFDGEGQFCDKGETYTPAIFVAGAEQQAAADASKRAIEARFVGQTINVKIIPAATFWDAEGYHQDYYIKNPVRYAYYRNGCGRDARLKAVWGTQASAH